MEFSKLIAERYIDFMLMVDEDFDEGFFDYYSSRIGEDFYSAAVANAEYTYYASPNQRVVDDEGYRETMNEIKDDAFEKMYALDSVNATYYENLTSEKLVLINSLWEELKSDIDVGLPIYVMCGAILAILIGGGIFLGVRKRIRDKY